MGNEPHVELRALHNLTPYNHLQVVQDTLLLQSAHLMLGETVIPWTTVHQAASNIVLHTTTYCHDLKAGQHNQITSKKRAEIVKDGLSAATQVTLSFRGVPPGTKN
jgi:hypothetical protein